MQPRVKSVKGGSNGCVLANFRLSDLARAMAAAKGGRDGGQTATAVPGLFGAGDVVDHHYQQAATAGGMGVKAALDADDYLEDLGRAGTEGRETVAPESDD